MNWEILQARETWIDLAMVLTTMLVLYWLLRSLLGLTCRQLQKGAATHSRLRSFAIEMLGRTSRFLILIFSLLVALKLVDLRPSWEAALSHGWFIALAIQIALWLEMAVQLWVESLTRDGKARNPVTTVIIAIMIRIVIWTLMLLSILANLGVDITAMVAGLGVGGIAIALAVQTLLSDIFASLSIGIDKPFEIGDFVVFGDVAGSIEHIGLKTTRIRSLSGEQIVLANAELLAQVLHNYKRMETRRIVFTFSVSYATPADKAREVSLLVQRIIEAMQDRTRFDRAHLLSFDQTGLTYEVVHIVLSSDYNQYMDIQQEINLRLMQGLQELGVRFAMPVREVEFTGGTLPEVTVTDSRRDEPDPEPEPGSGSADQPAR